jgi:hypothetical protein
VSQLENSNPSFEHVGIDDEGFYLDFGPDYPKPSNPNAPRMPGTPEPSDSDTDGDSDVDYDDDKDYEVEDVDEMVKDKEPDQMPDAHYDKKNPPMAVGTMYSSIHAFKIALATHAVIKEFHYDIEASDTGRFRANCSFKEELGCQWRIHASTSKGSNLVPVCCFNHLPFL